MTCGLCRLDEPTTHSDTQRMGCGRGPTPGPPASPSLLPERSSGRRPPPGCAPPLPRLQVGGHCGLALELRPGHPKALLRRGKARVELGLWTEAKADLAAVERTEGAVEAREARKERQKVLQGFWACQATSLGFWAREVGEGCWF